MEAVPVASTLPSLQLIPELPFISGHKGTQNKGGFGIRKYAIADYQAVTVKCEVNFEKHFIFLPLSLLRMQRRAIFYVNQRQSFM